MSLDIRDPSTNTGANVALSLPSRYLGVEQLIELLQTTALHLWHEEEDENNCEEGDASVDHANAGAEIAWLVLYEGVNVGDEETGDEADGCGEGDGAFAELCC